MNEATIEAINQSIEHLESARKNLEKAKDTKDEKMLKVNLASAGLDIQAVMGLYGWIITSNGWEKNWSHSSCNKTVLNRKRKGKGQIVTLLPAP